ncbi:MAG TPA: hypothetical protein VMS86_04795, partial [Thermoanaerobaculia bacterium]|nr:hypothetical protein [Thermoanaerobaculia bacterium]
MLPTRVTSGAPWARRLSRPSGVAVVLLLVALACGGAPERGERPPAVRSTPGEWRARDGELLLGGIQVREPDSERWIGRLASSGFNTVALTVYARQGVWDSADLRLDDEAPWISEEARVARAAGLRAVLVLRVALDHAVARNRFLWHGMILPRDDAQVGA